MGGIARLLRQSALAAAFAGALLCAVTASASAAPLVLSANLEGESVSVINSQTNTQVGQPIPVGKEPASVAITPNGRFAYVSNLGSDTVSVIEIAMRKVVGEPIAVGKGPETVAISPDGATAYVSDREGEEVSVINTQTNKVIAGIPVGDEPLGLAFSPNGEFAYVSIYSGEAVEIINTSTRKVVGAPIAVGKNPVEISFSPDGKTAYVADSGEEKVSAIDTSTRQVTSIPVGATPWGVAVSRDGTRVFVADEGGKAVSVVDAQAGQVIETIPVGIEPYEVALTPDGKILYVGSYDDVRAVDTTTYKEIAPPLTLLGLVPWQLAIAPDQSPTAAFTAPSATANFVTSFSGAESTDPDGTIASWNWAFGDGTTGSGVAPTHTYSTAGIYNAKLSVVDNEGCGEARVFTGRTAYCSGSVASSVTRTVTVNPVPNNFVFGRIVHNRKNGTVRMQVKLPTAGSLRLRGGEVHQVSKKFGHKGSMWLVVHPRIEVNKRLKRVHHIRVKVRVKFSPTGGTPKTKTRSFQLLRAPHKKHHHA